MAAPVLVCPALVALIALLALGAHPLRGQSAGLEPAVVELPAGARATGLGGAFQVGSEDSDAIFHHPGLLGTLEGMMLGYQHLGSGGRAFTLSAATDWYGGGVAVGLQGLAYEGAGPGARLGGVDPLLGEGDTGTSELVATVGYGRALGPVQVGVAGKLVSQRFGTEAESRGALDVGVSAEAGPLRVAVAARNLGPDYVVGGVEVSQPDDYTLGVGGYGAEVGPLDVGLAGAVTRRGDGEWIGAGGVEVGYWPVVGRTFVARVGARSVPEGDASPLTLGGSYQGDALIVDYAFQPVDGSDGIHRISLGWR